MKIPPKPKYWDKLGTPPKSGLNSSGRPGWDTRIIEADKDTYNVYRSIGGEWRHTSTHKSFEEASRAAFIFGAILSPHRKS